MSTISKSGSSMTSQSRWIKTMFTNFKSGKINSSLLTFNTIWNIIWTSLKLLTSITKSVKLNAEGKLARIFKIWIQSGLRNGTRLKLHSKIYKIQKTCQRKVARKKNQKSFFLWSLLNNCFNWSRVHQTLSESAYLCLYHPFPVQLRMGGRGIVRRGGGGGWVSVRVN